MIHNSGSRSDPHPWDVRAMLLNAKEETVPERRMDQTPFHFHPPSQFQLRRTAISVAFLMLRMTRLRAQKTAGDTFSIYAFRNTVTNEVRFRFSWRSEKKNIFSDTSKSNSPSVTKYKRVRQSLLYIFMKFGVRVLNSAGGIFAKIGK